MSGRAALDCGTACRVARQALEAGRADQALQTLAPLADRTQGEATQGDAQFWQLLGAAYREEQLLPEAIEAFARGVELEPANAMLAFALAQSSFDAGLPAVALFQQAREHLPDHPALLRGCAAALVAEGEAGAAETLLASRIAREPEWLDGHRQLATLRWTGGDTRGFARSYEAACRARPGSLALWLAWFRTIAQTRDWDAALAIVAAGRKALGDLPAFTLAELFVASESGDGARADALFDRTADLGDEVRDLAFVRHGLRTGRVEAAEAVALRLLGTRSAVLAWPYLSVIWRLRQDRRADWLDGAPPYTRVLDLPCSALELQELAALLHQLHRAAAPHLEQSVRGGTQTDGHVLLRHEPIMQVVRQRLRAAVREHVDALPAAVAGHPLLGTPRQQLRFQGSWSVLLRRQGFNVAHTHPLGWISSAFYVSLPSAGQLGAPPAGWLQLGTPPPELGVHLPPLQQVEPRPGRLVLFPSTLWHSTVPFDDGERLVLAFDVRVPRY